MKQKTIGIISLMTVMLFAFATAAWAGDFVIQNSTFHQIFTVNGTTSAVTAVGELYENSTALKEVYWKIASVATPSDGDTTHLSTADQIYDWVIGLGYTAGWDALDDLTLTDGSIYIGNSSNEPEAQTITGDITLSNAGVVSVINTAGLSATNITTGTIDNARITLVEDEIPTLSSTWDYTMDADRLTGLDALNNDILIAGENVSTGTVADARIDAAIARDSEVLTWVGTTWDYWNASTDLGDDELAEAKINFTTVCAAGNHLYVDGFDLACETDDDTTYTANTPLNLTGTVFDLINCADNQIYKMDGTTWTCEADGGGMDDLIDDTTPQLGGNLDVNDFGIDGGGSTNMTIDASGNFIIVLA